MNSKTFPGTVESIDLIRHYISEIAQSAGLDKKSSYNLKLAADEIATNIVLYGYEEPGLEGNIEVLDEQTEEALTVIFEDTSAPFDPLARELPDEEDLTKPLEERQIGGLGIFLTVKGVDDFSYERVGEKNRNIFKMLKGRVS
ncbi:ATP-binding protein [Persicitalea jodogahamensis]|uniref:Histidine kinase n=1 Tax=Persicitalea jodogahamensis TaxID=402147 RepID=A0A8J3D6L7_9BACT|nr:ATP-binding protein [Persicitalea jodogahamensis]GHB57724.1 histidine kinase [Persicitalea jodogahamensis]